MTPAAERAELELDVEDIVKVWPERPDRWLFISIPDRHTGDVDDIFDKHPRGFRSVPVTVSIGGEPWETALFRYRDGSWALPLKSAVRKRHHVEEGDTVRAHVVVRASAS